MTSGTPYIGSKISLISKAEIRYEGILYQVDTKEATVTLAKVRSFGTEDRPAPKHIPPRNETYEFIIFRGSDIKDLHVSGMAGKPEEAPPDPAILSVSSHAAPPPTSTSSHPIPQQLQPHPQGATPRAPSYNPFAAGPGMGAYSPFGMPYFRPPMMMGGGTPPHPAQTPPTLAQQQQPTAHTPVQQQMQPQAMMHLQQSHPFTAIPAIGTTQSPLPPSSQSIQSITPPRVAATAPPTSTPIISLASIDPKLQPQARSTPQQPVIEPPAAVSAASAPKEERTSKSSESPIAIPSTKPPAEKHPAQAKPPTQLQPKVEPQPPPPPSSSSSTTAPTSTPVTPARQEGTAPSLPKPPKQEQATVPASATAVEPSSSGSQETGAPADRRRQPNSYHAGGHRGRGGGGGYRGRRDNYRGPPRGGGPASASSQNPVYRYDSEFDFESANARFNKDDLEEEFKQKLKVVEGEEKVSNGNGTAEGMDEVGVEEIPADGGSEGEFYDKSKSFFDSISCESNKQSGAGRRPHWNEEREMNTETFGVSSVQGYRRGGRGRGRGGRGGRRGNRYRGYGGGWRSGYSDENRRGYSGSGRGGYGGGGRGGYSDEGRRDGYNSRGFSQRRRDYGNQQQQQPQ